MQTFDFVSGTILGPVISGGRYMLVSDHLAAMEEKDKDIKVLRNVIKIGELAEQYKDEQTAALTAEQDRLRDALELYAKSPLFGGKGGGG
jgi:hypothetical protein